MKARLLFLLVILYFSAMNNLCAQDSLPVKSISDSTVKKILIINSFDGMSMKARKNKKELFSQLADSLKNILSEKIQFWSTAGVIIIPELISETTNSDSTIFSLMKINNTFRAIVIKKLDAYFEQTGVEVVKESDEKKRTASFDICSSVTYKLYSREMKLIESETKNCEFFTYRMVVSGFLAAGPNIVGKSKYAFEIIAKNAGEYLAVTALKLLGK